MTSSINAGVNQTFSVTLSVAVIYLVVNEALLFNIFTRALYKIMQRDIFSFLIFIKRGGGGGGRVSIPSPIFAGVCQHVGRE